jgi:hypothetical protein
MSAGEMFRREVAQLMESRKCGWDEAWTLQKQMSPALYNEMEIGSSSSENALHGRTLKLANIGKGESRE